MWIPLEIPAQGLQTTRALVYLYLVNLCLDRVYSVLRALGQCVRLASHARGAFDRPTKHAAFFFDTVEITSTHLHMYCAFGQLCYAIGQSSVDQCCTVSMHWSSVNVK